MEYSNSHARASLDILALLNPAVAAVTAPTTRSGARHRRDVEPDMPQEYAAPPAEPAAVTPPVDRHAPVSPAAPAPAAIPEVAAVPAAVAAAAPSSPASTLVAEPPAPDRADVPFEVDFGVRRGPQRVALLAVLAVLPAAGYAGWQALQTQSPTWLGTAAILGGLTMALWVIRTTMRPAHLHLRDGILTITRGADRYSWDLAHHSSPVVAVRGRPGRPGWSVLLRQVHGEPVRIDASMVAPERFMQVLRAFVPEA